VSKELSFTVSAAEHGKRLDLCLVARLPALGRRGARQLCQQGAVKLDGRRAVKGEIARAGATVRVELGPEDRALPEPDAALTVLLERADLVVVDKPAGLPSTALRGRPYQNLASALLGRYPEMAGVGHGPREAGLVHRLDTQTSGVMVAARSPLAFASLRRALSAGEWEKRYLAVVVGEPAAKSGTCELPLLPHPRRRSKVVTLGALRDDRHARPATTRWRVLESGRGFSLLELGVCRAQRHQIRAHLAALGCPIAGDGLYGGPPCPELGGRHALHASYVAWAGDRAVASFAVESALPPGMGVLISG
jgi:23S rRNA pseudouridine1911/1915/1917 synthase